jgi:hypothetical protein
MGVRLSVSTYEGSPFALFWIFRSMPGNSKPDQARHRRMRYAERKLREAQLRLARTERSIRYWSRVLADLKYERTCAVQHPLWSDEDTKAAD